jgi:hypothetical protein
LRLGDSGCEGGSEGEKVDGEGNRRLLRYTALALRGTILDLLGHSSNSGMLIGHSAIEESARDLRCSYRVLKR